MTSRELEIVKKIENFGARYDPTSGLTLEDQLLACEAVAENTPVREEQPPSKGTTIGNQNEQVNDTGNSLLNDGGGVYGARYLHVSARLIPNYSKAILKLTQCTSETAPRDVAAIIEETFGPSGKDGWWLFVAQHWNPRPIISVLKEMKKLSDRGDLTIRNPPAFFTFLFGFRKKKKKFRNLRFEKWVGAGDNGVKQVSGSIEGDDFNLPTSLLANFVCSRCQSTEFWTRPDGIKLCSRCHPPLTFQIGGGPDDN